MNFLERWYLEMGLDKVFAAINGYKTYVLAGVGIVVSLVGHFWGPVTLAGGTIPTQSWSDVWKVIYASGIISALRHGISKGA
jgi:hypothetical protein